MRCFKPQINNQQSTINNAVWTLALLSAICANQFARAEEPDVLAPKDVLGWMAPLRIVEGRLDVDWTVVGRVDAKVAGVGPEGGKGVIKISRDVKFAIATPNAAANAPAAEVLLHIEGGSANAAAYAPPGPGDVALVCNITEKDAAAGSLRGFLRARGALSRDGSGALDVAAMNLNMDSPTCVSIYELNRQAQELTLKFKEEKVLKFDLSITQTKNSLLIHYENLDAHGAFEFTQMQNGEVELTFDKEEKGGAKGTIRGASLKDMIQHFTPVAQVSFLRPLSDAGVQIALSPDLPVVMAAATTGFSEPLPEVAKKADALITAIGFAITPEERARAVTELTRLYPQAIYHIFHAAEKETNADVKAALKKVLLAHPGIMRAVPYVQANKLHEDRAYLFELFEQAPFFKDAARARLAVLLGKDYGEKVEDWKK